MSNSEIFGDYLNEDLNGTTSSSKSEGESVQTEKQVSLTSKEADKSVDEIYIKESDETKTGDNRQYGLRKPRRDTITGILKT